MKTIEIRSDNESVGDTALAITMSDAKFSNSFTNLDDFVGRMWASLIDRGLVDPSSGFPFYRIAEGDRVTNAQAPICLDDAPDYDDADVLRKQVLAWMEECALTDATDAMGVQQEELNQLQRIVSNPYAAPKHDPYDMHYALEWAAGVMGGESDSPTMRGLRHLKHLVNEWEKQQ